MNNRKENEQSCIVMNKKEGTSCITTHLLLFNGTMWFNL